MKTPTTDITNLLSRLRDDGWSAESSAMSTMKEAADVIEALQAALNSVPSDDPDWASKTGYIKPKKP